ncbi:TetR/AcrR family transcriptional regulator [Pontibacter beigongshangensis]|uniref:TetR/AcrR family transcriptional regulator n=1 Tax=Pontibacter beigongshangensis TaxID=2574733 RepID=UPI00164EE674|nr:TetR/AcrR family transcriptional regulator [Pontibacter beigongshangensis]
MREKILAAAIELFNSKGIRSSTLRDIAKEISISDGHLRYYFKTKEDLILATFSEMEQTIASFAEEDNTTSPGAGAMLAAITKSFEVMLRYAFIFMESVAILEKYPKVFKAYQQLIENRRQLFLHVFAKFKEDGVFAADVDAALFPVLFEQFFILSDNWVKYARLPDKQHLSEPELVAHYVALSMGLFVPYFSAPLKDEVLDWVKRQHA